MVEKKKLGEMLLEKGLIDKMQLESAIGRQKQWGGRLGSNLVKLGYISEVTLLKFLSGQLKLPCADLSKVIFSQHVHALISKDVARQHHVFPLDEKEVGGKKVLFVAMSEPTNIVAIDEIAFLTGLTIKPVIAADSQIEGAIQKHYDNKGWIRIEPLKEKVADTDHGELKVIHEVSFKEKKAMEQKAGGKGNQVMALVNLLTKKGVITADEYIKELSRLGDSEK